MSDKLRELIAKWRKEGVETGDAGTILIANAFADELEAALAESGAKAEHHQFGAEWPTNSASTDPKYAAKVAAPAVGQLSEEQLLKAELQAQIVEATWWAEEGLDLENYISPEEVEKRLNFLRNTLGDVKNALLRSEAAKELDKKP